MQRYLKFGFDFLTSSNLNSKLKISSQFLNVSQNFSYHSSVLSKLRKMDSNVASKKDSNVDLEINDECVAVNQKKNKKMKNFSENPVSTNWGRSKELRLLKKSHDSMQQWMGEVELKRNAAAISDEENIETSGVDSKDSSETNVEDVSGTDVKMNVLADDRENVCTETMSITSVDEAGNCDVVAHSAEGVSVVDGMKSFDDSENTDVLNAAEGNIQDVGIESTLGQVSNLLVTDVAMEDSEPSSLPRIISDLSDEKAKEILTKDVEDVLPEVIPTKSKNRIKKEKRWAAKRDRMAATAGVSED